MAISTYNHINKVFTKVVSDFDNFYNSRRRILFHLLFWLCLLLIYTVDLLLVNSTFNINITFVLALRQILQSVFAFYFICYLVIPKLIISGKYIAGIIGVLIPIVLAPLINYFVFVIFFKLLLTDELSSEYIKMGLFVNNPHSILSFKQMILSFMPLVLRTMPAFVMKLLVSTVRYFHNSGQQQEREHELERNNLQLEINFLKSQMNPHFFFNTLNNIYSYVFLKDDKALSLITDLSEIMQYTLYATKEAFVPLDQELKFLEHYLSLEKTRYEEQDCIIKFDFDYANTKGRLIAPLILFPFLENAFKHGIRLNKERGWLEGNVSVRNGSLYFYITNNKTNIAVSNAEKSVFNEEIVGGIGVSSTIRRLYLLYPEKHKLIIDDQENSYSVSLKINCRKDEPKVAMHYS